MNKALPIRRSRGTSGPTPSSTAHSRLSLLSPLLSPRARNSPSSNSNSTERKSLKTDQQLGIRQQEIQILGCRAHSESANQIVIGQGLGIRIHVGTEGDVVQDRAAIGSAGFPSGRRATRFLRARGRLLWARSCRAAGRWWASRTRSPGHRSTAAVDRRHWRIAPGIGPDRAALFRRSGLPGWSHRRSTRKRRPWQHRSRTGIAGRPRPVRRPSRPTRFRRSSRTGSPDRRPNGSLVRSNGYVILSA